MEKLLLVVMLIGLLSVGGNYINDKLSQTKSEVVHLYHHNTERFEIDTVSIHGSLHEFIYDVKNKNLCHSPECWCFNHTLPVK